MASRIMHLAAAEQLVDMLPEGMDIPRFFSGTIMVDSAPQQRVASHYLMNTNGRKTYDAARFREEYGRYLLSDGLVLGYYLHLVQDLVFRDYMYHELRFNPRIPGYLAGLHSDYRRLNQMLVKRFSLHKDFSISVNAAPLDRIADFDMAGLPAALDEDFACSGKQAAFFFTEDMAVTYIGKAVEQCRRELYALCTGGKLIDPMEWTWQLDPV